MSFNTLAAAFTASALLLTAAPLLADDAVLDLGGGFRIDTTARDAFFEECMGNSLHLKGAGGIVRRLQTEGGTGLRRVMSVVVIAKFPPEINCQQSELTIVTANTNDMVYLAVGSDVTVRIDE